MLERKVYKTDEKTREEYESGRSAAYDFQNDKFRQRYSYERVSNQSDEFHNQRRIYHDQENEGDDEEKEMDETVKGLLWVVGSIILLMCAMQIYEFFDNRKYDREMRAIAKKNKQNSV